MSTNEPAAIEGWSVWPAPAKLNLFLHIIGRRTDGYHELQTVFRLLEWGDTVHLRPRTDGRIVRHGESAPGVDADDDLMVRAARLLQTRSGSPLGADIRVEKRIPSGGGFGGGSSDAATVLVALNHLWAHSADGVTALDVDELAALGLRLGADVPVFVRGENAWAEGIGERLMPLVLPPTWYVLADPGVCVPTAELFQAPDLTRTAQPARIADFVSGPPLGNAFEPVLRRREPAVEAAFQALAKIGIPHLTGSGSGCFVEFEHRDAAEAALRRLSPRMRVWCAAGAAHSPLQRRLAEATKGF